MCVFASILLCVFASILGVSLLAYWIVNEFTCFSFLCVCVSRKLDLTLEAHFFQLTMYLFSCCLSFSEHFRHMREKD